MSDEKKLTPDQLRAVEHKKGPLLIIAGAGTGKTTVITKRIEWLITKGLAKPEEILALTFTEKASQEMEERIDRILPYGYTQMWIMTFHSFCDRVLRDHGFHIGLPANYRLLTGTDSLSFLQKKLFDLNLNYFLPLGNPNKFLSYLLSHFSRLQDEDISPADYISWANSLNPDSAEPLDIAKSGELSRAYQIYSDLKIKASLLDFADLITHTLALFRKRPNILKEYRQKFKYILVDEFQDTNYSQNQLVNLLAGAAQNITVVGDDDQAIYRWRGAAISNIIQFKEIYPNSELVVLKTNFRSTRKILDAAYTLIQNNNPDRLEIREKINKKLVSARKVEGDPIKLIHVDRVENEADTISREIKSLIETEKYSSKDFAVLVRANAHALPFIKSFAHFGIPHQFLGPAKLFDQPEIKDLIAYFKVCLDLSDSVSFYRLLSSPFFNLDPLLIAGLSSVARKNNLTLYEAVKNSPNIEFSHLISSLDVSVSHLSSLTAGQILYEFLENSQLLRSIINYSGNFDEQQSGNIIKFFNKLKGFEAVNENASVEAVLDWINLSLEMGESPAAADTDWNSTDAVNILTVHSAKGLEFPVVFLVNLVSQRFPTTEKSEPIPVPDQLIKEILPQGDFHIQEERRLFYVGMTRARDRLYFTAADFYGEGKRAKKLSPFISESLGENDTIHNTSSVIQSSLLDWRPEKITQLSNQVTNNQLTYLSYSQIQTFIDCPLHYKAKYILKLTTPPSAASSFGNTIHLTLKDFYIALRSLGEGGFPNILDIYKRNWTSQGYLNKKHEASYFTRGEKYLKDYVAKNFDSGNPPVFLESPFTVPVRSPDGKRIIKIGGKIDRIDNLGVGKIEIIDYKTSVKPLTQKEADSNLQLSFYALAAAILTSPPFGKSPDEITLSLYYFEDQKKVTTTRSKAQLDSAVSEIFSYVDQIESSDFSCSGSIICRRCDFTSLCDVK